MKDKHKPKFIFTIGGVLSGVGKGVVSASLGMLLKNRGYKVAVIKIDPYISIDAGTMRPAEHGEVFVTADGGEIDQDLGTYERFMNQPFNKQSNITTGKVYQAVIDKERSFFYQGRDAQFIPDVINQIKEMILSPLTDEDFVIVEIGGTTGDTENLGFLYAAREMAVEYQCQYLCVSYVPFLKNVGELKTKPTQHAATQLRTTGISPDFIITRNEIPLDLPRKENIAKRCFIPISHVIDNPDVDTIYQVPLTLEAANLPKLLLKGFNLPSPRAKIAPWIKFIDNLQNSPKMVNIGLIGKYLKHGDAQHQDVYVSVIEAIKHAAGNLNIKPNIITINSEDIEIKGTKYLNNINLDAIIIPQGWGSRGTEGKIIAANYARTKKIPYLGLCFGMQLAVISFARNVANLESANSEEIDSKTPYPVIHLMPDQKEYLAKKQYGGTIRLGQWPCQLTDQSLVSDLYRQAAKIYDYDYFKPEAGDFTVLERHRHRYEFNNQYRDQLEAAGLVISGVSPDGLLVEMVELPRKTHPFYIATQAHPEYQSRINSPHPLFLGLVQSALDHHNL